MDRRNFLLLASLSPLFWRAGIAIADSVNSFDSALAGLNIDDIINAKKYIEPEVRRIFRVETQGAHAATRSKLTISQSALDLIIAFEVSSEKVYRKKLIHPIWPGGASGPTFGIGYDAGYASASSVTDTWGNLLDKDTVTQLSSGAGKTGRVAQEYVSTVQHLVIEWEPALAQFTDFLPFVIAQAETSFQNLDKLSPDSRGALVSLVYNRGSDASLKKRREEMYYISQHMASMEFDKIPAEIEKMKKLWPGKDQRGLLLRRDLEAQLFRAGLASS